MNKKDIVKLLMREDVAFVTEAGEEVTYGSESHINELDELVKRLQVIKKSLKRGGDRHKNRKEIHRIQGAVESIRFLKRKAERAGIRKGLISEAYQGAAGILTPKDVDGAVEIYSSLIDRWGQYLKEQDLSPAVPISRIDPKYDISSDAIFLVGILPERGLKLGVKDVSAYQNLFLEFVERESFLNIDVEKTLCISESLGAVIRLPSQRLVHIEGVPSPIRIRSKR